MELKNNMDNQEKKILEVYEKFKENPQVINQGKIQTIEEFDRERIKALDKVKLILIDFFENKISVGDFKQNIDSLNKKFSYWGFRGINGQMFFNMLYKSSPDKEEFSTLLKEILRAPKDIGEAKIKIKKLLDYVGEVSQNLEDKRKAPRAKSSLFFISYFWQIQEPKKYPIFYNSFEQALLGLNLLEPEEEKEKYYEDYYNLNFKILGIYKTFNTNSDLWFVEHVFWAYQNEESEIISKVGEKVKSQEVSEEKSSLSLSYIPPIISDLVGLSLNEANPIDFEKKTQKTFEMLGFETEYRGQGKRDVDVLARAYTDKCDSTILIDCKARSNESFRYNAGDERKDIEYIKNFRRENPRKKYFPLSYMILSSGFDENSCERIRKKIIAETGVDITFLRAKDLLYVLELKLKNSVIEIDSLLEIFTLGGILNKEKIQEILVK